MRITDPLNNTFHLLDCPVRFQDFDKQIPPFGRWREGDPLLLFMPEELPFKKAKSCPKKKKGTRYSYPLVRDCPGLELSFDR